MDADDGLKIHQNDDGTFSLEWDWLNGMTSKEIVAIIEQAVMEDSSNVEHNRGN